jgi:pectate lyase
MFTKIRFLILFLLIGFVSNAQSSYSYTAESFEDNIWGNAASSFNTIKTATGDWIVAKNNIQSNSIAAQDGTYSLVIATKTASITTPRLDNGAGTLSYYAIRTGSRNFIIETSTDNLTWTPVAGSPVTALATWTKHLLAINNSAVRYIRFSSNSNGGLYIDNVLITDASPEGMKTTTGTSESITQTSMLINANVINTGTATITSRGICYNKTGAPDINSSKTTETGTTGDFASVLTGLEMGTTYYVKAYAITNNGVSYGLTVPVKTRDADPSVNYWTQPFDNTAYFPGAAPLSPQTINVPDQGDWIYLNAYKSTSALYIPDGSAYAIRLLKGGSFITTPLLPDGVTELRFTEGRGGRDLTVFTSINGGTSWTLLKTVTTARGENTVIAIKDVNVNRVRIANNSGGDAEVDNISVSVFPSGILPTLTTTAVTSILKNSAVSGGDITDAGNKTLVERGLCWSTVTTPIVTDNKIVAGNGIGTFTANLTGLPAGTLIHLRAYAISRAGTAYGNEINFTTQAATIPVISTTISSAIKGEYAISGGNITDEGGAPVTVKGICWNTTGNPTIADTKSNAGVGSGLFTDSLINLTPSTTYYYRAYASNSAGTAYGNVESLTTGSVIAPTITTSPIVTSYSFKAEMGGEITNDGGAMTTQGLCWNTSGNPTIADSFQIIGSGQGVFSKEITGLVENMKYYVRAYVTTNQGTFYGNEVAFNTPFSTRLTQPIGYGRFTTGGGTPTPQNTVTVTSAGELSAAINGPKLVILVSGTISTSRISAVMTNKSIIGLPGARLVNLDQTAAGSGIFNLMDGSKNIIIQNITFEGPGAYDADGWDLISNKGTYDLWVDHCDFQDGMDGLFDNTNESDNITVSWCKFSYKKPPVAGGSGGSADHRFANLIGGSDSDTPKDGFYNITWQNCWWAEGVKARMVRGRNVDIHILNSYWNSSVAADAIGMTAGTFGCKVYVEGGHFDLPATAKVSDIGAGSIAVNFVDCIKGDPNYGVVAKPTYEYFPMPSADVKNAVTSSCGAGATLIVSPLGEVFSSCPTTPLLTLNTGSGFVSQEVYAGNPINAISYVWGGTATDVTVADLADGLSAVKDSQNKTITISGTPTTAGTYTITTVGGTGLAVSKQGTITITSIAPPTLTNTGTLNQVVSGGTVIADIQFTWGDGATDVTVTGLANGLTATKNIQSKTLTINGVPTGSKSFKVETVGGSGNAVSLSGNIQIKYTSTPLKVAYVTNPSGVNYGNDTKILPALKADPNFDVTEVSSANSYNDYSTFDVIVYSEVAGSDEPGVVQLRGINKPVVMMKVNAYKTASGAWGWATEGFNQSATDTYVSVSNKNHAIFRDVTWVNDNQVQMLSVAAGNKSITYMDPSLFKNVSGTIQSMATLIGQPSAVSILEVPAGTLIANNTLTNPLIQIGLNSNSYAFVTEDGISIVKNAILYLSGTTLGVEEHPIKDKSSQLVCYPTLVTDHLNLEYTAAQNDVAKLTVINLQGRIVYAEDISIEQGTNFFTINLSNLASGLYVLKLETSDSKNTQKIIKK